LCNRGNCFSVAGILPNDLRTTPGAMRIMTKISNKDPIRAKARVKTNELSTMKKIGTQTKSERNKYV